MTAQIINWLKNDELAIRQVVSLTFPDGQLGVKSRSNFTSGLGYQKHLEQRQAFYRDRVLGKFFAGERDINKALRGIYDSK